MNSLEARQIKQRDIDNSDGIMQSDLGRWGIYEHATRSFRLIATDRNMAETIAAECNLKSKFGG